MYNTCPKRSLTIKLLFDSHKKSEFHILFINCASKMICYIVETLKWVKNVVDSAYVKPFVIMTNLIINC